MLAYLLQDFKEEIVTLLRNKKNGKAQAGSRKEVETYEPLEGVQVSLFYLTADLDMFQG